jgi:His/Glu/Gln/Arg/opine family amino acid ABC transporter permease subunit
MALHASNHRKEQGRWWYDAKVRALLFQCLAIAAVIGFLFYIVNNALTNLATRGITTGFDFLGNTAGFGILQSLIPYDETYTFGRTFVVGLLNTLLVSVLGILFATLLGFALGVARLSRNWLVAKIAAVYIETFRNIPLLLQIFFWYFSVLRTLPSPRQSVDRRARLPQRAGLLSAQAPVRRGIRLRALGTGARGAAELGAGPLGSPPSGPDRQDLPVLALCGRPGHFAPGDHLPAGGQPAQLERACAARVQLPGG